MKSFTVYNQEHETKSEVSSRLSGILFTGVLRFGTFLFFSPKYAGVYFEISLTDWAEGHRWRC